MRGQTTLEYITITSVIVIILALATAVVMDIRLPWVQENAQNAILEEHSVIQYYSQSDKSYIKWENRHPYDVTINNGSINGTVLLQVPVTVERGEWVELSTGVGAKEGITYDFDVELIYQSDSGQVFNSSFIMSGVGQ